MEAVNRKLIRPSLNEIKEQIAPPRRAAPQKKPVPPDQTNAENFYYVKQMQAKTPMVFVLARRRDAARRDRVVRQVLPEGEPHRRAESAALQAQHQVHVQRGLIAGLSRLTPSAGCASPGGIRAVRRLRGSGAFRPRFPESPGGIAVRACPSSSSATKVRYAEHVCSRSPVIRFSVSTFTPTSMDVRNTRFTEERSMINSRCARGGGTAGCPPRP